MFENLVNYDKSKTKNAAKLKEYEFENLVNYDKSKTINFSTKICTCLRTL